MVCIWTDDPEYPFYEQCHAAYETLSNAVDAKGRKLKVYKLCMPVKPLYMDQASCDTIDAVLTSMYFCPIAPIIFAPSRQLTMSSRTNANCPILAILLSSSFPSARP